MVTSQHLQFGKQTAAKSILLRIGIVGVNFGVMVGLAAVLGFGPFGQLAVFWGSAMVVSTLVSVGGPVILLRMLTDGQGLHAVDIVLIAMMYPAALCLIVWAIGGVVLPDQAWLSIVCVGFVVNLLGCLASVLRALESVHGSMVLRDAGPQAALGLAAIAVPQADVAAILLLAALGMLLCAAPGMIWAMARIQHSALMAGHRRSCLSMPLWATSVTGMFAAQMDLILGGAVISGEALGVYALLRRVANLVALPVSVATWISGPAISAAKGANDMAALARASAYGSYVAILPGLVLFGLGVLAIPVLPFVLPQEGDALLIFAVLLAGGLVQVILAASFTVANLCDLPQYALAARLIAIGLYCAWYSWWGDALSTLTNAAGYVGALSIGGLMLWWALRQILGIDTSSAVLWRVKGVTWKAS